MKTGCKSDGIRFQDLKNREVIGSFNGGTITSDAGGILLREVEKKTGIIRDFASCFADCRDKKRTEHTVEQMVSQRIYGLCGGYDDLNDHDSLRCDPLFAVLCGKEDPTGSDRKREEDRGKPLAGKSTLNRLELTPAKADEKSRYKKIVFHSEKADDLLIDIFIRSHPVPPEHIRLSGILRGSKTRLNITVLIQYKYPKPAYGHPDCQVCLMCRRKPGSYSHLYIIFLMSYIINQRKCHRMSRFRIYL